ncbi:MAG: ATP-binding cassette domain-containing protein [Candidatus Delongbacteria bacterium]|nr:ATP-binding cassette domain-containing protein [Candidatus Delongbacteria bacterium]
MSELELKNVTKWFGDKKAVDIQEMKLESGTIWGFLGPNGAGKTTTIRMIMQIIKPDQGEISFDRSPLNLGMMDRIGYLPEERGLYKKIKLYESLEFFGRLKGISTSDLKARIPHYLEKFSLSEYTHRKVEALSKGMQQKLQFITTIIHQPDLIILDEPFSGLDPLNAEILQQTILEESARGATIIFSTHMMERAEQLCKHIVMINQGVPVLNDSLAHIKQQHQNQQIKLIFQGDTSFLNDTSLIRSVVSADGAYLITLQESVSSQDLLKRATAIGTVIHFSQPDPSLFDIFIQIAKKQSAI